MCLNKELVDILQDEIVKYLLLCCPKPLTERQNNKIVAGLMHIANDIEEWVTIVRT